MIPVGESQRTVLPDGQPSAPPVPDASEQTSLWQGLFAQLLANFLPPEPAGATVDAPAPLGSDAPSLPRLPRPDSTEGSETATLAQAGLLPSSAFPVPLPSPTNAPAPPTNPPASPAPTPPTLMPQILAAQQSQAPLTGTETAPPALQATVIPTHPPAPSGASDPQMPDISARNPNPKEGSDANHAFIPPRHPPHTEDGTKSGVISCAATEAAAPPRDPLFPVAPRNGIAVALPENRMLATSDTEKLAQAIQQKLPPPVENGGARLATQQAASLEGPEVSKITGQTEDAVEITARPAMNTLPAKHLLEDADTLPRQEPGTATVAPSTTTATAPIIPVLPSQPAHNPARLAWLATEMQDLAVELLHFKADSLAVLIRPDAATALQLRLVVIAGRVHAQAKLQTGEASWLQAGWADLQRVLQDHNIVLEGLKVSDSPLSQAGSHGHQRPPRFTPPPAETDTSLPATQANATAATPASTAPPLALPRRGREWWA